MRVAIKLVTKDISEVKIVVDCGLPEVDEVDQAQSFVNPHPLIFVATDFAKNFESICG